MGLREQAKLDARAILEDDSGFAWPVTLTSPLGVVTSLKGFTTDVGQSIDPETGQAVAGRRASVVVPRAALPMLPEAVAEKSRKPWIATFADSQGVIGRWKVIEVLPDAAIGLVSMILEIYELATVKLAAASIALPQFQLFGQLVPAFEGALVLPQLQASGTVNPVVSLAGSLALPQLQLAGTIAPVVGVAGSVALPQLQASGTVNPAVTVGGSIALPQLQLSGTLTVNASPIAAWLRFAQATITGVGYSSVPDILGATSPAVQATDARRPNNATSSNGLPIANCADDFLTWPLAAAINGATKSGFACWVKSTLNGPTNLFVIWLGGGGASANKVDYFINGSTLQHLLEVGGQALKAAFMSPNVWHFVTAEYDGTQGTDAARCLITVDGVVLASTNTSIPTSQPTPTGNAWIAGFGSIQNLIGSIGPNFWALARQLTTTERNNLMAFEAPVFLPSEVSAVAGWLRLAQGTVTGSGYSNVPDFLNGGNPATQSVDADRPPSALSANSLPIMDLDGSTDFLSWPAAANNNQTVTAGFGFWFKPDVVTGTRGLITSIPGATNRVELLQLNGDLVVDVYISQFVSRRGTKAGVFSAGTWYFITWEYNGGGATDADKCTLTINSVVQTLTFSDSSGTPGAMPATLVSTAGPHLIGCRIAASHTGCFDGKFGPHIYSFGSAMIGVTQGLLVPAARGSLMAYDQPT